jgi:hypothetical protein
MLLRSGYLGAFTELAEAIIPLINSNHDIHPFF